MCCLRLIVTCICGTTSPVHFRFVHQIARPDKLEHRRPHSSQTMICSNTLPDGGIEKYRLRRNVRMTRQIRAKLCLNKCVGGEELIKAANVSNVVVPLPKPRALLPVGSTAPAKQAQISNLPALIIESDCKLENITRLKPSVVSPTPPYQV